MTPDTLAKSGTEHAHQRALFAYTSVACLHGFEAADEWAKTDELPSYRPGAPPAVPALEWYHAIHNQGHGDAVRGARAKAEGVRSGVSDTFLPWPSGNFYGLYIEMKTPLERPKKQGSKGGVSNEQAAFGAYASKAGYAFTVCYSWQEAVMTLRCYIVLGILANLQPNEAFK